MIFWALLDVYLCLIPTKHEHPEYLQLISAGGGGGCADRNILMRTRPNSTFHPLNMLTSQINNTWDTQSSHWDTAAEIHLDWCRILRFKSQGDKRSERKKTYGPAEIELDKTTFIWNQISVRWNKIFTWISCTAAWMCQYQLRQWK